MSCYHPLLGSVAQCRACGARRPLVCGTAHAKIGRNGAMAGGQGASASRCGRWNAPRGLRGVVAVIVSTAKRRPAVCQQQWHRHRGAWERYAPSRSYMLERRGMLPPIGPHGREGGWWAVRRLSMQGRACVATGDHYHCPYCDGVCAQADITDWNRLAAQECQRLLKGRRR